MDLNTKKIHGGQVHDSGKGAVKCPRYIKHLPMPSDLLEKVFSLV